VTVADACAELATTLTQARKRLGWSLRTAERASGVPNAHISQIETGAIAQPGFTVIAKLAKAYGLEELTRCPTCGKPS
jgi:transcriptional regulator with XRE-family HTH domain